ARNRNSIRCHALAAFEPLGFGSVFNSGARHRFRWMHNLLSSNVVQERLGLGCDRLGSVLGIDGPDAARLVDAAFESGIRFFDTANIYGQGESERILGCALRHHGKHVTIVTKAGHYFPTWTRFAEPFKRAVAPWLRRSDA